MAPDPKRTGTSQDPLGETYAKFELFQRGWNPYSRFIAGDHVDLIIRRTESGQPIYREVCVLFDRLHRVAPGWEARHFDLTAWRFFDEDMFDLAHPDLFIAYVLSDTDQYRSDIFFVPVREFVHAIKSAPRAGDKRRVYLSRRRDDPDQWVVRRQNTFDQIDSISCLDFSKYRRAFHLLEPGAPARAFPASTQTDAFFG